MRGLKRAHRVRVHLVSPPGVDLPSVEGLLVANRRRELAIALPSLIVAPEARPADLESRLVVIPLERVAFWEHI